jgi:hypothetical protein
MVSNVSILGDSQELTYEHDNYVKPQWGEWRDLGYTRSASIDCIVAKLVSMCSLTRTIVIEFRWLTVDKSVFT